VATSVQALAAGTVASFLLTFIAPASAQDQPKGGQEGVVVQERGPIHEAFAQPLARMPEPMPIVPKKPPQPVPELPPDQKPQGVNVQWIPGYWSWDLEKKDFIWVSGFWRDPPPGRNWVAGHWVEANGGWQYVNGFWAGNNQQQPPQILPQPPASIDNGPSVPQSGDNVTTAGSGHPEPTPGARAATPTSTATGITRLKIAGCSSRPCLSRSPGGTRRDGASSPGSGSTPTACTGRCSSIRFAGTFSSATSTAPSSRVWVSIPGTRGAPVSMIRFSASTPVAPNGIRGGREVS
jgi:hypothetical protein